MCKTVTTIMPPKRILDFYTNVKCKQESDAYILSRSIFLPYTCCVPYNYLLKYNAEFVREGERSIFPILYDYRLVRLQEHYKHVCRSIYFLRLTL